MDNDDGAAATRLDPNLRRHLRQNMVDDADEVFGPRLTWADMVFNHNYRLTHAVREDSFPSLDSSGFDSGFLDDTPFSDRQADARPLWAQQLTGHRLPDYRYSSANTRALQQQGSGSGWFRQTWPTASSVHPQQDTRFVEGAYEASAFEYYQRRHGREFMAQPMTHYDQELTRPFSRRPPCFQSHQHGNMDEESYTFFTDDQLAQSYYLDLERWTDIEPNPMGLEAWEQYYFRAAEITHGIGHFDPTRLLQTTVADPQTHQDRSVPETSIPNPTRPIDPPAPWPLASPISKIWGVTYEPNSRSIYAADRDGHRILRFTTHGGDLVLRGMFPASLPGWEESFRPTGITCDEVHQRLVVTDKDNHRICFFAYTGYFLGFFGREGEEDGEFSYPWGVAVSPNGELIVVADSKNHRLQLFSSSGEFIRKFPLTQLADPVEVGREIDNPRGISFDSSGRTIYVTDFNIHNLFAIDLGFGRKRAVCPPRRLYRPQGLAVDETGNILVADTRNHVIRVVRPDGVLLDTIRAPAGWEPIQLPVDICVCHNRFLCVVDLSGSRIRIF